MASRLSSRDFICQFAPGLSVLAKSASAAKFNAAPNATYSAIVVVADRDRANQLNQNRDHTQGGLQINRQQLL